MADPKPTAKAEVPQYQLTERAYINDKILEEGAVIYFKDPPGPHMVPLNDAATAQVEKYRHTWADPSQAFQQLQHAPTQR